MLLHSVLTAFGWMSFLVECSKSYSTRIFIIPSHILLDWLRFVSYFWNRILNLRVNVLMKLSMEFLFYVNLLAPLEPVQK